MRQKQEYLHLHFTVKQLSYLNGEPIKALMLSPADEVKYNEFVKRLAPDQVVDVFYDANKDDGTLAQLAKIHACIKQLAMETGYSFEDMKLEVKRASGLCVKKEIGGEMFMVCKSFSRCSKEELSLAIQTLIELGDSLGSNLR